MKGLNLRPIRIAANYELATSTTVAICTMMRENEDAQRSRVRKISAEVIRCVRTFRGHSM
jgi:hypothetical protein